MCVATSAQVLAVVGDVGLAGAAALARRARFRDPRDGDDHVAARLLVRLLLAESVPGTSPGCWVVTQRCEDPRCRRSDQHGWPDAKVVGACRGTVGEDISVSWSHAAGVVAVAVGAGVGRVGVDAEPVRPEPPLPGRGWRAWVRGEALVKAGRSDLGGVLGLPLDHEVGVVPMLAGLGGEGWVCDLGAVVEGSEVVVAVATCAPVCPAVLEVPLEAVARR